MHIILNHSSMVPIYEQLMEQIKSDIINSSLKEGEALPSVRSLAGELRISALTVKKAYDKLEEEGLLSPEYPPGSFPSQGHGRWLFQNPPLLLSALPPARAVCRKPLHTFPFRESL